MRFGLKISGRTEKLGGDSELGGEEEATELANFEKKKPPA